MSFPRILNKIMKILKKLGFHKAIPLPEKGIYHFKNKTNSGESRMHLRIEADGSGMLLVNASRAYHFNPTAAYMTYLTLKGIEPQQAVSSISKFYNASKKLAAADYEQINSQIKLLTTPNYDKISAEMRNFMGFEFDEIKSLKSAANNLSDTALEEQLRFIDENDSEELIDLIPTLAALESADQDILIKELSISSNPDILNSLKEVFSFNTNEINHLSQIINLEEDPIEPIWDTILPFSKTDITAPYRMDLALTYRCNNNCPHCYNARERNHPELATEEWKTIIDHLWDIGIPHIIFTGGEPTLRDDLAELIAHAENNGQITGINTNGRKLSEKSYVQTLVDAGLDHVQITLESHDPKIHDQMVASKGAWEETVAGIKNVLETKLYLMTNTTMLKNNKSSIMETLEFLGKLGLERIGLNALIYSGKGKEVGTGLKESELPRLLEKAIEKTESQGQKLTWYTPTQYCHFDPVLFDHEHLGVKGCTAALYNMCIEADGNVIPCQSFYQPIGNILKDDWEDIWNHKLAVSIRERKLINIECQSCSIQSICGGGCPLAQMNGSMLAPKAISITEV